MIFDFTGISYINFRDVLFDVMQSEILFKLIVIPIIKEQNNIIEISKFIF
jgi:hypothetical protein